METPDSQPQREVDRFPAGGHGRDLRSSRIPEYPIASPASGAATLASAERVSDVINRSTTYYMLRNDREGLYHSIQTMADEPGMIKVRILDQQGRISYSTDPAEVSHVLDKTAEACYGCHDQSQPLARLNRPDRFRIYRIGGGHRVLGIITPIENQPSCSNAACHAHPASQQVLGVLDTNLSLAKADTQLAVSSARMLSYTAGAMLIVAILSWLFVWRVVDEPIKALKNGTEHLAHGELGYQIDVRSQDEVGDLAHSFNGMSLQLRAANEEIVTWAKTLEDRVEQKTTRTQARPRARAACGKDGFHGQNGRSCSARGEQPALRDSDLCQAAPKMGGIRPNRT